VIFGYSLFDNISYSAVATDLPLVAKVAIPFSSLFKLPTLVYDPAKVISNGIITLEASTLPSQATQSS
jgi:hypothetical protein